MSKSRKKVDKEPLKKVITAMLEKNHMLSANDILSNLEKSNQSYNKTSIYRSLEKLLEEGIVCRHYFDEAQAVYELREHHHTHLVCSKCGHVDKASCDYSHPQNINGFKVEHHHLTLVGICKDCE